MSAMFTDQQKMQVREALHYLVKNGLSLPSLVLLLQQQETTIKEVTMICS